MSDSSDLDRATKAKAVLDNPAYQKAYEDCRMAIIDRIDKCPLNDVESAENLRKCLRLLRDVQGNMVQALNSGNAASFKIEQERKAKLNPFRGLFR